MVDREKLFGMLQEKQWDNLFEQLYQHRKHFKNDPILAQVRQYAGSELLGHLKALDAFQRVTCTRHLCMLVQSDRSFFPREFWQPLIEDRLQAMFDAGDKALPGLANDFMQELPLARVLLMRLQLVRPEEFADARRSMLNVRAVQGSEVGQAKPKEAPRHVSCLFRSPQERAFYEALGETHPGMLAISNMAVAVAIPFEPIKARLSEEARSYYWKAQFDCVLLDRDKFLPHHFFELDSSFHNQARAMERDALKEEICRAAGIKLVRVRGFENAATTQASFAEMIRDLKLTTQTG